MGGIPGTDYFPLARNLDLDNHDLLNVGSISGVDLDLSGTLTVDTINEHTGGVGVNVEGVLLEDGTILMPDDAWVGLGAAGGRIDFDSSSAPDTLSFLDCIVHIDTSLSVDAINEYTGAAGVTIDGVLIKDNGIDAPGTLRVNTIDEYTGGVGVTIDSVLLKDNDVKATSFTIGGNTLDTNEWANLDGINQSLATGDSPTFVGLDLTGTLTVDVINEHTGAAGVTIDSVLVRDSSITIGGNTLDTTEWAFLDGLDQALDTAQSPTWADVYVTDGGNVGIAGNELLTFNAAGNITVSGANIIVPDNFTLGLIGGGHIEWDDQAVDEINFLSCRVSVGTNDPVSVLGGLGGNFVVYQPQYTTNTVISDHVDGFASTQWRNNAGDKTWLLGIRDTAASYRLGLFHHDGTSYSAELVTVLVDGKVGIGDTAPIEKLTIKDGKLQMDSDASTYTWMRAANASPTADAILAGSKARGTIATPTATQLDDYLMRISFGGYGATGWKTGTQIRGEAVANWTDASSPGRLLFLTTPVGSTTPTESFRVLSDQNVLVAGTNEWQFGDDGTFINQGADGHLDVTADISVDLNSTLEFEATTSTTGHITQAGTRILHTYGTDSFFAGAGAGNFTQSGALRNTGIGTYTLDALTSGDDNTAGGYGALGGLSSGLRCTAFGSGAASVASASLHTTAFGYNTMGGNTSSGSSAFGAWALYAGDGNGCAGFGYAAGYYETGANKLFIDNDTRANEADGRVKALVYGIFAAATADQYFTVNGHLTALEDLTIGTTVMSEPGAGTIQIAGDLWLIDSGSDPRLVLGDHSSPGGWGSIGWVSASDSIGIGTDTGGVDTLLISEAGNVLLAGTGQFQFRDPQIYLASLADGHLDIEADVSVDLNSILEFEATTSSTGHITQAGTRVFHTYGTNNLFIGSGSGNFTVTGSLNVGVGAETLDALTSGDYNVSIGFQTLSAVTAGVNNVAIGYQAATLTTGNGNTAIGSQALAANVGGIGNFAMGYRAAFATTGGYNLALGYEALVANVGGTYNVAIGPYALHDSTATGGNVAIGYLSLGLCNGGVQNTGIGAYAGQSITANGYCTAVGYQALSLNTGLGNTAVGRWALYSAGAGELNTAVGLNSLWQVTSGTHNTAIGTNAGFAVTTGVGGVYVGNHAGYYETAAAKLFIDNTKRASPADGRVKALVYGVFDVAVANQSLMVNGLLSSSYGAKFGDGGISNYTEFEADGTRVAHNAATSFDDIYTGFSGARVPAANAPNWEVFTGNLNAYTFAINDFLELNSIEIEHSYLEGSNYFLHVHWATNGQEAGDTVVRWEIEYTIANSDPTTGVGDAFAAAVVVSAETTIPAGTPDLTAMYTAVAEVDGSAVTMEAILGVRVRRVVSLAGDAPAANPFGQMVGVHIEKDTDGSRAQLTK